jgi:hypothetical protein
LVELRFWSAISDCAFVLIEFIVIGIFPFLICEPWKGRIVFNYRFLRNGLAKPEKVNKS